MRGPLPLLLLLLAAGCAGGGLGRELSADESEGAIEAVYRYQLAHDARPTIGAFCLCTPADSGAGGDPSVAFLRRFAAEPRPVFACSACAVEEGRIVERASGKTALTLYIASVRPLPAGEVEVEGGVRTGRLSSTRVRYRVVRQGAGWKVADALGPSVR
jgi:hypothetical protein